MFHFTFTVRNMNRKCPCCGREQTFKSKPGLKMAISNNSLCRSCSKMGEKNPSFGVFPPENIRKKYPIFIKGDLNRKHVKINFRFHIQENIKERKTNFLVKNILNSPNKNLLILKKGVNLINTDAHYRKKLKEK